MNCFLPMKWNKRRRKTTEKNEKLLYRRALHDKYKIADNHNICLPQCLVRRKETQAQMNMTFYSLVFVSHEFIYFFFYYYIFFFLDSLIISVTEKWKIGMTLECMCVYVTVFFSLSCEKNKIKIDTISLWKNLWDKFRTDIDVDGDAKCWQKWDKSKKKSNEWIVVKDFFFRVFFRSMFISVFNRKRRRRSKDLF